MKGIDKGDIVSSGAPQMSKDGRNQLDFTQSRRMKLGSLTCYLDVSNFHVCLISSQRLMCDYITYSKQVVKKIYLIHLTILKMKVLPVQKVVI